MKKEKRSAPKTQPSATPQSRGIGADLVNDRRHDMWVDVGRIGFNVGHCH